MADAIARIEAYAARLEQLGQRFNYAGGKRPDTHQAGINAQAKLAWHDQMAADLRLVCAAARELPDTTMLAQQLVERLTFDDSGAAGVGGNGGLVSRETIRVADHLRLRLSVAMPASRNLKGE